MKLPIRFPVFVLSLFLIAIFLFGSQASTKEEDGQNQTLFRNVNIFDGRNNKLSMGMNILVVGNLIERISKDSIEVDESATVIEGEGRTLMPGLIDGHAVVALGLAGRIDGDKGRLGYLPGVSADLCYRKQDAGR